jgi:molybdopterin converting factor small subunit
LSIKLFIPPLLQHIAGYSATTSVEGTKIGECLHSFTEKYPGVRELLFDQYGELPAYIEIYLNGESIYPQELTRQVKDGDELIISFVIIGG